MVFVAKCFSYGYVVLSGLMWFMWLSGFMWLSDFMWHSGCMWLSGFIG